jgi:hypothetical protein
MVVEINVRFDLENERDKEILNGMRNVARHSEYSDSSEALKDFIDSLMNTLDDCENKRDSCFRAVKHFKLKELKL